MSHIDGFIGLKIRIPDNNTKLRRKCSTRPTEEQILRRRDKRSLSSHQDGKNDMFRLECTSTALVALVSCEKQATELNNVPISFDLRAKHPDGAGTKSVKSGWEDGDKIFIVFTGVESPNYLTITYDGGNWIEKQMSGKNEGFLPLIEGDEGTMTAIFLPFAKEYTYLDDADGAFVFSEIYMSYYLSDTQPYSVVDGKVSGIFDMKIPDGFVQFYMDAEDAADGKAMLWEPNVMPYATTGVAPKGFLIEGSSGESIFLPAGGSSVQPHLYNFIRHIFNVE